MATKLWVTYSTSTAASSAGLTRIVTRLGPITVSHGRNLILGQALSDPPILETLLLSNHTLSMRLALLSASGYPYRDNIIVEIIPSSTRPVPDPIGSYSQPSSFHIQEM